MKDYTDGYFKQLSEIERGYDNLISSFKAKERKLTEDNDIVGLRALILQENKIRRPFSPGYTHAKWAWLRTTERNRDCFTVSHLPASMWISDFVTCLREAGVHEFVVTAQDANMTDFLVELEERGCKVTGLKEVHFDHYADGEMFGDSEWGIAVKT